MQIAKETLFITSVFLAVLLSLVVDLSGNAAMAQTEDVIAHEVIDRRESAQKRLSLTVVVQMVDGRIPFERELRALTEHLFSLDQGYKRKFVTYFLPGMDREEGAFASGQYRLDRKTEQEQPILEVFLRPYNLSKYPEYAKFAF